MNLKRAQRLLAKSGFDSVPTTGEMDDSTRDALGQVHEKHGGGGVEGASFDLTRHLDEAMQAALLLGAEPRPGAGALGRKLVRIARQQLNQWDQVSALERWLTRHAYRSATPRNFANMEFAWCASFVTWVYEQAGLTLRNGRGFASVKRLKTWAQQTGQWHPRVGTYKAIPGSIAIMPSHVGLVVAPGDGFDHTIEGNTSRTKAGSQRMGNQLAEKKRWHTGSWPIFGYVVIHELFDDAFGAAF